MMSNPTKVCTTTIKANTETTVCNYYEDTVSNADVIMTVLFCLTVCFLFKTMLDFFKSF